MENESKGNLKVLLSDILTSAKEYDTRYVYELWGKKQVKKKKSLKTTETSRNEDRSKFIHLSMLQAWSRTLQKSSIFASYLKLMIHLIKAKNPKHFAISLHFHPLKGNLLKTMLYKFSTNSKGTFNSIMHYHWQMEGWRWACFLRVLKRCSVVKGNIL